MKLDTKYKNKIKKKIKKKFFFQKKKLQKKIRIFFLEKWKKVGKIMRENAHFFNKKTRNCKTRKIEKIEFFRAFCVHTQKIFMRQLFDVMLFSKNSFMMFEYVLGI